MRGIWRCVSSARFDRRALCARTMYGWVRFPALAADIEVYTARYEREHGSTRCNTF